LNYKFSDDSNGAQSAISLFPENISALAVTLALSSTFLERLRSNVEE